MPKDIRSDACHIWHFRFEDHIHDYASLVSLLSSDEHIRLNRYQFESDQLRFGLSRALLRKILSLYTDIEPNAITFQLTEYKKPYIDYDLEFNISHTNTDVVIGIAHFPIGIDIETTSQQKQALAIAKRFFTQNEYHHLEQVAPEILADEFIHMWTQKEAIVKAIGKGVFHDLKNVEVSPLPNTKILNFYNTSESVKNWSLFPVDIRHKNTHCICAVKGTVKKPVMMAF